MLTPRQTTRLSGNVAATRAASTVAAVRKGLTLIGLGSCLALCLAACGNSARTGRAEGSAQSSTSTSIATTTTTTTTTTVPPTTTTPTTTTTTTGAGAPEGGVLSLWYTSTGQTDISTLSADWTAIGTATSEPGLAPLAEACQSLNRDVVQAQGHPAIPDPTLENAYSTALSDWEQGSSECVSGIDNGDNSLTLAGGTEMQSGITEFNVLNGQLSAQGL